MWDRWTVKDGIIGTVALADLQADNLATEQIRHQIQIEPASDQCGRKVRHVPAPHLPRSRGDVRVRRADTVGCFGTASMPGLSVSPQYTAEARFTGDVDAFVREHRHDARRWEFRKTRFVRDLQDPLAFLLAQRMVRHWTDRFGSRLAVERRGQPSPSAHGALGWARQSV